MMTPDSSRYWPLDEYAVGTRRRRSTSSTCATSWTATGWNHEPPAPHMPPEVIANTRARYREAYELLTGASFDDWFGPDDA